VRGPRRNLWLRWGALGPAGDGNAGAVLEQLRRRLDGRYAVDEWGYDPDLVDLLDPLLGLRWRAELDGAEHVPPAGPAVVVASRRLGLAEPLVLARAVRVATGRAVRFLGIPDVAPVGPVLRRLGGAVGRPEELAGLLRADQVCALSLGRTWRRRHRPGSLAPEILEPALAAGAPVLPAAVLGGELSGRWRVVVGEPLQPAPGRGPLALAELAEAVRDAVQALLDEELPPHWLLG
jgi:hypothetical protein